MAFWLSIKKQATLKIRTMIKTISDNRNATVRTGNEWGDLGSGENEAREDIQNSRIWMDTYTTAECDCTHMGEHIHKRRI
jgi:hypothetical protein